MLVVDCVSGSYRPAHAVADEENLDVTMLTVNYIEKGFEVIKIIGELLNIPSATLRPAVPSVVKAIDRIAFGYKAVDYVYVASAMLSEAVDK